MALSENGASFDEYGGIERLGPFALLRESRVWLDHDSVSDGRSWANWSGAADITAE